MNEERGGAQAGEEGKRPRGKAGCVDAGAKRAFLKQVKAGARLGDAARGAGCSMSAFYKARAKGADFADDWADALELSALRERAVPLPEIDGETVRIAPNNKRALQVRKTRHVKFVGRRVERFLSHFAGTGDVTAAARAAGVDERAKLAGRFPELEDQLCAMTYAGYEGAGSPDRADAMVWAMTELFRPERAMPRITRL